MCNLNLSTIAEYTNIGKKACIKFSFSRNNISTRGNSAYIVIIINTSNGKISNRNMKEKAGIMQICHHVKSIMHMMESTSACGITTGHSWVLHGMNHGSNIWYLQNLENLKNGSIRTFMSLIDEVRKSTIKCAHPFREKKDYYTKAEDASL